MKNFTPYIKPTRYIHDSGFRIFEVGYCKVEKGKVIDKKVLGRCTDHVWNIDVENTKKGHMAGLFLNMDMTKDGYIRFFTNSGELEWDAPFALSTMGFKVLEFIKIVPGSSKDNI